MAGGTCHRLLGAYASLARQEGKTLKRTAGRKDWLNGTYFSLARCAQEEGGGPCGWRQAARSEC